MLTRIAAIVVIYGCTVMAWMILGSTVDQRTGTQDENLKTAVGQLWGTPQHQRAPQVYYQTNQQTKVQNPNGSYEFKTETTDHPLLVDGSDPEALRMVLPPLRADLEVVLHHEHRPGPPLPLPIHALGGRADPLVTREPSIRFYAGVPLRAHDGQVLGTLCVIDRQPRLIAPGQLDLLTLLAGQVMALLELRRTAHQLRDERQAMIVREAELADRERQLQSVFDGMVEGVVVHDRSGAILQHNPAAATILGGLLVPLFLLALGLDMHGVITLRSLREGLKYCMRTMGLRVVKNEAAATTLAAIAAAGRAYAAACPEPPRWMYLAARTVLAFKRATVSAFW